MTNVRHPNRKNQPALGQPFPLKLPSIESIKLDNGLPFFLLPDKQQEVTRIDFVFDAGTIRQDKILQAVTVNKLLSEGTKNRSALEIAELLDYHGAYLDRFVTKDSAGITLYSLTKYVNKLLPLMVEIITEAIFPEDEIKSFLDRRKQQFLVNNEKVNFRASLEFNRMIFGARSAYGKTMQVSDFDHLTRHDCLDFYQNHYRKAGFYGMISGNFDESILLQINNLAGQIPNQEQSKWPLPATVIDPGPENIKLISKKKTLQSALRTGCLTINQAHDDYPCLALLNTVLGGYFGSRLMSSIREDKGFTYGIYSFIQHHRHADYFGVSTEVNAQNTEAALEEVKHQIEKLSLEKIPAAELETVKNYIYGSYLRNFDGSFVLAERFLKSRELGLNFELYGQVLSQMMNCTSEALLATAQQYLNPDKMKILVVGNTEGLKM